MKEKEKLSAGQLAKKRPGVFNRRHEIILSLCRSAASRGEEVDAVDAGQWIVDVANAIIERTEQ